MTTTESVLSKNNRIVWMDISRGIAMLIIISGHTFGGLPLAVTVSFNVCLFFIFSGITTKFSRQSSDFFSNIKKRFIRLMLPAALAYIIGNTIDLFLRLIPLGEVSASPLLHPGKLLLTLLFSRIDDIEIGNMIISQIGILWFFATLFSTYLVYDIIQLYCPRRIIPLAVSLISIAGVLLGHFKIVLPLNLDIAMGVIPLVYIGELFKIIIVKADLYARVISKPVIKCAVWAVTYAFFFFICQHFSGTYFKLSSGEYPLYPLCLFMALSGTIFMIYASIILSKLGAMVYPLIFIGQNTLYIYSVHSVDKYWKNLWQISSSTIINYICRILVDITIVCIILQIRKFFSKNQNKSL